MILLTHMVPSSSFETLISRLFRDRVQFRSGLGDLVVGVRRHLGGGHRLTVVGERFVERTAENLVEVGDRGRHLREGERGYGVHDGEPGNSGGGLVASEPVEKRSER